MTAPIAMTPRSRGRLRTAKRAGKYADYAELGAASRMEATEYDDEDASFTVELQAVAGPTGDADLLTERL